jgi:DNA-binding MarR family transcriptional regulator
MSAGHLKKGRPVSHLYCLDNTCLNNYDEVMSGVFPSKFPARKSRHFDSLQQEAFLHLWRTYDRLRIEEDQLFETIGLTPQQYNALRLLRAKHPHGLQTLVLAERLVSRAPDITRLLDKLETRALIRRDRPVENRRIVEIRITEAGLTLLQSLDEAVRRCHARQLGHVPQTRLRQLIALLEEARRPHESPESSWAETS